MTEPMDDQRLDQIRRRMSVYGPTKVLDRDCSARFIRELLDEVDRLKILLEVEEEEFAVTPLSNSEFNHGDIVEIVAQGMSKDSMIGRWGGVQGRVTSTDTGGDGDTRIRIVKGHERPDGMSSTEFYWPTSDLKLVKRAR